MSKLVIVVEKASDWGSYYPSDNVVAAQEYLKEPVGADDELVAALAADGVPVQQAPYDAFWGARYAVVSDPDGHGVGIMSPIDPAQRHDAPEVP